MIKAASQGVFYLAMLAILAGRSASAVVSHDEIQFIAPGQVLVQEGWLPYIDYPFVHAPYAVPFYALSAWVSDYDYLAARFTSTLAWLGCILLMVAIARQMRHESPSAPITPSWRELLWEFVLVYIFVNHGPMVFLLRAALNHSFATLFALLSIWFLIRGLTRPDGAARAALFSGASIATAGLVRLNFAALAIVLLVCWVLIGRWHQYGRTARLIVASAAGGIAASLPAIGLAMFGPSHFYYGNFVYIRLNTIYYEQLLHKSGMNLTSKLDMFRGGFLGSPVEVLLYAGLIVSAVLAVTRIRARKRPMEVARLGLAGIAAALWLSAFAPTPGLLHYFSAPIPFLFVLLGSLEFRSPRFDAAAHMVLGLAVLALGLLSDGQQNTQRGLAAWQDPSRWPPVQVHAFGDELRRYVDDGRLLTLNPVPGLEAGLEIYPFTATGPFSWRTSLLLTAQRRQAYGVISPEELQQLLAQSPPDAILAGFEAPNAGFEMRDQGGLETPFTDYAAANGYTPVRFTPELWPRGLTLWIRP